MAYYSAKEVIHLLGNDDSDDDIICPGSDDDFDAADLDSDSSSDDEIAAPMKNISDVPSTSNDGTCSIAKGKGKFGRGRARAKCVRGSRNIPSITEQSCWSDGGQDVTMVDFTKNVGPTITISASPLQIFLHIFTVDLLELIVTETNRYAQQCNARFQTNKEEILAYLGFTLYMAIG